MDPKPASSLPSRTLRCANGALYMLMALCTAAAAAYAAWSGKLEGALQLSLAAGGALAALLWAACYATLHYRVGESGLTRSLLGRVHTRPWAELRSIELDERDTQGVASCSIRFVFSSGTWRISSDLFDPDSVQELKNDLISFGLLHK